MKSLSDHQLRAGVVEEIKKKIEYHKFELRRLSTLEQIAQSVYVRALRLKPVDIRPLTYIHVRKWVNDPLREFFDAFWQRQMGAQKQELQAPQQLPASNLAGGSTGDRPDPEANGC